MASLSEHPQKGFWGVPACSGQERATCEPLTGSWAPKDHWCTWGGDQMVASSLVQSHRRAIIAQINENVNIGYDRHLSEQTTNLCLLPMLSYTREHASTKIGIRNADLTFSFTSCAQSGQCASYLGSVLLRNLRSCHSYNFGIYCLCLSIHCCKPFSAMDPL